MALAFSEKIAFKVAHNKIHQVLTPTGEVTGVLPDLSDEQMLKFYRWMVFGRTFSDRMVALQRQGRMGTFAPINGQEAAEVAIAAPLQQKDWLIASYREGLSYVVKGIPFIAQMKQWGGYITDDYPRELNCLPFQVVLGAQMLHAVGVAQAIQYSKKAEVVMAACGDGATSEGDFNEALNFAGVYKAPVVFVVQNNGWAISTPRAKQTAAEYIADRGPGFGIPSYVVDGNDFLALYQIISDAVERARAGNGPTLIEAITYRLGAHTTADDPTKYRDTAEVAHWAKRDPLMRFRKFLINQEILTDSEDKWLHEKVAAEIQAAIEAYEALEPQTPDQLFDIVYATLPRQLQRQKTRLFQDMGLA